MKKVIFIIFLFLMNVSAKAQYRKMPLDTNHYWQHDQIFAVFGQPYSGCTYKLKIIKDSIVNGKTYKFLNATSCGTITALLRQDTVKKLVIQLNGNQELILYNFNKNVGDTALLPGFMGINAIHTLNIKDSLLLSDGFYHKRFKFNSPSSFNIAIEGIGSIWGLLTPWSPFELTNNITCVNKVWPVLTTIYSSGGVGAACPIQTSIKTQYTNNNEFQIYPNPTSDILNIKSYNELPKSIQIQNVYGQTILIENNIQQVSSLKIKDFPQGIYFIKINFDNKSVLGRFVKN